jgi:hypothetical protein
VRPTTDFLLAFPIKAFTISDIAHITDSERADLVFNSPIDNFPADLVFKITMAALLFSKEAILLPLQFPPAPRTFGEARLCLLKF